MRYLAKKVNQRFERSFGYAPGHGTTNAEKEGSVTIDSMPSSGQRANGDVGEYVDYEEID